MHCKPIHANAILAVFQHIMRANVISNVEYVPMIFVHTHVLDGGRNRAMYAFMADKLRTDEMKPYVTDSTQQCRREGMTICTHAFEDVRVGVLTVGRTFELAD